MIRFSGDITRIVQCLWDEERVRRIISHEWEELSRLRQMYSSQVEEATLILNGLRSLEDCRKYVATLSESIRDILLVALANDLKILGDDFSQVQ